MKKPLIWQQIAQKISHVTNKVFKFSSVEIVSGGDINEAYILHGDRKRYFVKLNQSSLLSMFEAEFLGLNEIINTQTILAPKPMICGVVDDKAFIVLEYVPFARASSTSDKLLGKQLAQLHQQTQPFFGWHRENTIGSTRQINTESKDWVSFWQQNRLLFQLETAMENGFNGRVIESGNKLVELLPFFFSDYTPEPALLHGDLWAGNTAVTEKGVPIIYDPACYYGDREADIAMTELFGGFSNHFYSAYEAYYPLDAGYPVRKKLYNLYHILNHLNLFGDGYLHQTKNMIESLLAEVD